MLHIIIIIYYYYLESTKVLENTHPEIFRRFMCSQFVVKDRTDGYFHDVAPGI